EVDRIDGLVDVRVAVVETVELLENLHIFPRADAVAVEVVSRIGDRQRGAGFYRQLALEQPDVGLIDHAVTVKVAGRENICARNQVYGCRLSVEKLRDVERGRAVGVADGARLHTQGIVSGRP